MGNIRFDKEKLLKESNGRCYYCGTPLKKTCMYYEHVYPKSRGGSNRLKNIVPACLRCNRKKGTKTIEEWRDRIEEGLPVFHVMFYFEFAGLPEKGEKDEQILINNARRFKREF